MFGVKFILRKEIDEERWNRCVLDDPFFRPYALSYYLDEVAPKWNAVIDPDYRWVWPLPQKTGLVNRVYQPLLTQQLGPYGRKLTVEELVSIWSAIVERNRWVRVKFNDRYGDIPFSSLAHTNIELDLSHPYAVISSGYNRNVKSNLKKAEKSGVEVTREATFNQWCIKTFRESSAAQRSELDSLFYRQVAGVYNAMSARGEAESFLGKIGGKVVAQVLMLKLNHRLTFFFSAASDSARNTGAMPAVIDHIIKTYSGGHWTLDFEGSNSKSLAFFYKSFGGNEKVYLQAESKRLFWPLNRLLK